MNEFVDYSLEMLVERVRDAVSSTEQHTNTALLTSTPRRLSGCLDPVLCPRVRSSPQPDADVLLLDRLHNGRGRGDEAKQESKFQLLTKLIKGKFKFSTQNQIKFRSSNFQNDQNLSARFSKISRSVREKKKEDV